MSWNRSFIKSKWICLNMSYLSWGCSWNSIKFTQLIRLLYLSFDVMKEKSKCLLKVLWLKAAVGKATIFPFNTVSFIRPHWTTLATNHRNISSFVRVLLCGCACVCECVGFWNWIIVHRIPIILINPTENLLAFILKIRFQRLWMKNSECIKCIDRFQWQRELKKKVVLPFH